MPGLRYLSLLSIRRKAGEAEAGTELVSGSPGAMCIPKLKRHTPSSRQSSQGTTRAGGSITGVDKLEDEKNHSMSCASAMGCRPTGSGHVGRARSI